MSSDAAFWPQRRYLIGAMGVAVTALALPVIGFGQVSPPAVQKKKYPSRVADLVERSLVIDMLAPLKLDFTPNAYSQPLTDADAATVSYTHLRAHETGRNLVCRLLLEKKK